MNKYLLFLVLATVANFSVLQIAQAEVEFKGFALGKPLPKAFDLDHCYPESVGKYCIKNTTVAGFKTRMTILLIEQNGVDVIYQIHAKFKGETYESLKYALIKKYGEPFSEKNNPFIKSIRNIFWFLDGKDLHILLNQKINVIELHIVNFPLIKIAQKMRLEDRSSDL